MHIRICTEALHALNALLYKKVHVDGGWPAYASAPLRVMHACRAAWPACIAWPGLACMHGRRIGAERNNYYRLERALAILTMHPGSKLSDFDIDPSKPLDYDFRWVWVAWGVGVGVGVDGVGYVGS